MKIPRLGDVAPTTTAPFSPAAVGEPEATQRCAAQWVVGEGDSSSARSGARQARVPNELSAQALPRTRDPLPVAGSTPEAE